MLKSKIIHFFLLSIFTISSAKAIPTIPELSFEIHFDKKEDIQKQVQLCRGLVMEHAADNRSVLQMLDETFSLWINYYHENADFDIQSLLKATVFSAILHEGQSRKDAELTPYIIHPIGVSKILWQEGKIRNTNVLVAALLHDTLEDTSATEEEIEKQFGKNVLNTVLELTNNPLLSTEENKKRQIDNAPSLSPSAKLVKLADRLYNIRDLKNLPPSWGQEKKRAYLNWGSKLLEALRGTNAAMEKALEKEIAEQSSSD